MPPVGFEPTIPASERLKTHALDRAATGTGNWHLLTDISVQNIGKYRSQLHGSISPEMTTQASKTELI